MSRLRRVVLVSALIGIVYLLAFGTGFLREQTANTLPGNGLSRASLAPGGVQSGNITGRSTAQKQGRPAEQGVVAGASEKNDTSRPLRELPPVAGESHAETGGREHKPIN